MHIYDVLLERFVYPLIGHRPVKEMTAPDFLEMLRRVEEQGEVYSARRIANICSLIMRFAVASGRADMDPLPSLRGSLKRHKTKHLASTTNPAEIGRLLKLIHSYSGSFVVASALKIAPYVFVRPNELRHARWADIDFEKREWRYTATKTNMPHIVPLAPQVIDILKNLYAFTGQGEWVFPSLWNKGAPMGKTSLIAALRFVGISSEEMTPHGFRAMARTLLDEELRERYDIIEQQLAHMVRDPNGRAYNRTVHLEERHRMMERWAMYLDKLRDGEDPATAAKVGMEP